MRTNRTAACSEACAASAITKTTLTFDNDRNNENDIQRTMPRCPSVDRSGAQTSLVWLSAKKTNAMRISSVVMRKPTLWQRPAGMIVLNGSGTSSSGCPVLSCNLRKLSSVVKGTLHRKCSTAKWLCLYSTGCAVRSISLISFPGSWEMCRWEAALLAAKSPRAGSGTIQLNWFRELVGR